MNVVGAGLVPLGDPRRGGRLENGQERAPGGRSAVRREEVLLALDHQIVGVFSKHDLGRHARVVPATFDQAHGPPPPPAPCSPGRRSPNRIGLSTRADREHSLANRGRLRNRPGVAMDVRLPHGHVTTGLPNTKAIRFEANHIFRP